MSALLNNAKAAELPGIAVATLDNWRSKKRGPVYLKIGGSIKYRLKDIEKWMRGNAKLSWSTRMDIRNIFSSVFTCARDWKMYQDENPIAAVYVGRKRLLREKRKLTDDQTRRLLAAVPGDVRLMCSVALFCTLRVSEILGLQEKHLDFEQRTIRVEQRFYRGDLDIVKGQKSERTLPMGHLIHDLQKICFGDRERFVFQIKTRPDFGIREALCRDDRAIQQHFIRPAAEKLGFYWKGFGMHALRREAVTSLSATLGVNQAMNMAGHSTSDMSLAYTLADFEAQDAAVKARQEKILGKPEGEIQ